MGFIPISIEKYLKMHLKNNPSTNESDLKKTLNKALADFQDGKKCSCGNDIWVIASASAGNSCYTCITGEIHPIDDYEIDSAIKKSESKKGRRHIDDIDPTKIAGFFDDDGYEINTDLIRKPSICLTCIHDDNPNEEIFCCMTRNDQKDEKEFKCFEYFKLKR